MARYCLLWCLVLFPELAAPRPAGATPGLNGPGDRPLSVLLGQDPPLRSEEDLERRMATVSIIVALVALGVAVPTLVWCQKLAEIVTRLRTNMSDSNAREQLAALANEFPSLHARVDHLRQCWQADTGKFESAVRQLENRTAGLEQGTGALATVSQDLDGLRAFRTEVQSVLQQFENRTVKLERGYNNLDAAAKDLDSLRAFRGQVESILPQLESKIAGLEQRYGSLDTVSRDLDSLRAFRSHVERVHAGIQKAFNGTLAAAPSAVPPDVNAS
jgi:exonuclease VII small subunit